MNPAQDRLRRDEPETKTRESLGGEHAGTRTQEHLRNGITGGDKGKAQEEPKSSAQPDDSTNRSSSSVHAEQLCANCEPLGISEEKFLVNGRQTERGHTFPRPKPMYRGMLKTSSNRLELGTLKDIYIERKQCPVCALIWESTGLDSYQETEYEIVCYGNWEVDGRGVKFSPCGTIIEANNLTRRIHLRWSDPKLEEAYIILVTPTDYVRPNSDAPRSWRQDDLFLGRQLEAVGKNQALMSSWVSACNKDHGERCQIRYDRKFEQLIRSSYFGVIDVKDLMLRPLPQESADQRYVALSYVWGNQKPGEERPYRTLLENISLHKAHGGLEAIMERLPRVITDAIEVCRKLQIRYLWVDSLCIVQDSKRSWALNAASMDTIYGNAHLTICAADGENASAGLVAIHDDAQMKRQLIKQHGDLRLTITKLAETGIQRSEWNKRAWTFCERMLSKRCLIFTQGHVYFQCRSTAMSEDIVAEPKGAGWSLGLVNAPLQILRELKPGRRPFWVYLNCVELYTHRKLTFGHDILHAFYGMANLLSERMGSPLLFGLPTSHFDLALLWTPTGPIKRRIPKDTDDQNRWGDADFPTWSWCGWTADDAYPNSLIGYSAETLDGSIRNINEWLCKHTWIHWFIRDGHGNLRPVFHIPSEPDDEAYAIAQRPRHDGYYDDSPPPPRPRHVDPDDIQRRRINEDIANDDGRWERARQRELEQEEAGLRSRDRQRIESRWKDQDIQIKSVVKQEDGYACCRDASLNDLSYGRLLDPEIADKNRDRFYRPLPEYPFSVNMAGPQSEPSVEFPDQKYLQFWTWTAWLHIAYNDGDGAGVSEGLTRFDILDATGDWAGTIVLEEAWIQRQSRSDFEFVALSDAKRLTTRECPVWTFYLPKERHQSQWDLYFVLLIERSRGGVAKRVGLGKVFKAAFDNSCHLGKSWSEVILA